MADVDPILLSSPDVGPLEREALLRAFDSGWVAPVGPELDAFEADLAAFTGWPGTVAMSSGTAALHLALLDPRRRARATRCSCRRSRSPRRRTP